MVKVCNWGNYPCIDAEVFENRDLANVAYLVASSHSLIARGNGRSYGDSSLASTIFSTLQLNKILSFDTEKGIVKAESGVLLDDLLKLIVPNGFFLPVTPGTRFITLGGAVAANVHGKNHHKEGGFGSFVDEIEIILADGTITQSSPENNPKLFSKTIGGMGLTGVIATVTIRLKPIETSFIKQKSIKAQNLARVISLLEEYQDSTYSVAWIDSIARGSSMGRSVLLLGEHASVDDLPESKKLLLPHSTRQLKVPSGFPSFALNKWSIKAFNFLYYHRLAKTRKNSLVHYAPYFYPLDAIGNWNRIYGKHGFTQYQFVLPFDQSKLGLAKIMKKITHSGFGSFLAVLKTLGESEKLSSPLSFPMPGFTLALDFKIASGVFQLLNELDKIVIDYGGRLNLTKDARMSAQTFEKTYGKGLIDSGKFSSRQAQRLIH